MKPIDEPKPRDKENRQRQPFAKTAITGKNGVKVRRKGLDKKRQVEKLRSEKTEDPLKIQHKAVDKLLSESEKKMLAALKARKEQEAIEKKQRIKKAIIAVVVVIVLLVSSFAVWNFFIKDDSPQKCQELQKTFNDFMKHRPDKEEAADVILGRMANDSVGARYTRATQGAALTSQVAKALQNMKNLPQELPSCTNKKDYPQAKAVVDAAIVRYRDLSDITTKLQDDYNGYQDRILCQESMNGVNRAQDTLRDAMSAMAVTLKDVDNRNIIWKGVDARKRNIFETTIATAKNQQSTASTLRTTTTCHTKKEAFAIQANSQNIISQADTLNQMNSKIKAMLATLEVRDQDEIIDRAAKKYEPEENSSELFTQSYGSTQSTPSPLVKQAG